MELTEATRIAQKYLSQLHPYCERAAIAGSIRRKKKEVKDIEIVCIPKREPVLSPQKNLFGGEHYISEMQPVKEFRQIINSLEKVKGDATGRYTQRLTPEGIKIDFFFANPKNYGYILCIRTGSAEFSKKVVCSLKKANYICSEGEILRGGRAMIISEEKMIFDMLGWDWVAPELRN